MSRAKPVVVLVVDDEPPVRELLRRWLEPWGYEVKEAGTASEALDVMLADPASIVLLDIRMPGHSGLWLMERVQAKWPGTPIIMATGVHDPDLVLKSKQFGAVGYVTKPFGRALLRQALDQANAARDSAESGAA